MEGYLPRLSNAKAKRKAVKAAKRIAPKKLAPKRAKTQRPAAPSDARVTEAFNRATRV